MQVVLAYRDRNRDRYHVDIETDCDLDTDSDPELLGLYGSLEMAGAEGPPQRVPALAMRVVADSCACPKCDLCESACQGTSSQPHGRSCGTPLQSHPR